MPTAASWTLLAGNCSGSCTGICRGLLGLCKLLSWSLAKSCDSDRRIVGEVNAVCPLTLPYSAPEDFRVPEVLAILVALPLLLFSLGCFLTVTALLPTPGRVLLAALGTMGASSGTMATRKQLKPSNARAGYPTG